MIDASPNSHEILVNGRSVSIAGSAVQSTLLDFLRDQGLTGAKEGCAEGECGACMILVRENHGRGNSIYTPVNSCLMFTPMAAGREIYTVEGLAENGNLCEAQRAMAAGGGSQCGYCTPGFVVSLYAEQYRPDRKGPCDPLAMSGNLCRCTGYRPIRDAALSLGPAPAGPMLDRLSTDTGPLPEIKHETNEATFERPQTLEECLTIAAADPEMRFIAGATDLSVDSNLKFHRWKRLVSIERVEQLREFQVAPAKIRMGAGLSLSTIERFWRDAPEAFHQWLTLFASPPIRNRATLGGNLATASPIGDSAPLLMALDASVEIANLQGRRIVPLSEFFTGYRKTVLAPGELITAVEVPKPLPLFNRFYKVAKRRADDISTVAAGMSMHWDSAGRVSRAIFAFGGVAATPLRCFEAEDAIIGQRWSEAGVERVQSILDRVLKPMSDHRGSAEYRKEVAKSLIEKFWWESRQEVAA